MRCDAYYIVMIIIIITIDTIVYWLTNSILHMPIRLISNYTDLVSYYADSKKLIHRYSHFSMNTACCGKKKSTPQAK